MSNLIVKRSTFWHSRLGVAIMVAGALLLLAASFETGRFRAGYDTLAVADNLALLHGQIDGLEQRNSALREQKAILERSGQIERQAYKQLEGTVTGLQDEILELKEELAFYRGIVSPTDASKGLKLQNFELTKGTDPRQYHYKVVLTQVLNNGSVARGSLQFEVAGLSGGVQQSYTLEQISDSKGEPAFKFKYFQILEGNFILPEGFEPIKVNLTVKAKSKAHNNLTQAFDWVVTENS